MSSNIYQTKNYYIAAYHYIQCWANALIVPSTTKEVADAISFYYKKSMDGTPVTLRASRPKFHSSSHFPCPNSPAKNDSTDTKVEAGTKSSISVGLLQSKLNKVLAKDYSKWTMRVQSGIRYTEFLQAAEQAGMSVQVGSLRQLSCGSGALEGFRPPVHGTYQLHGQNWWCHEEPMSS
eukprot:GHRR01023635.1.p1 GENE.GHRR01023635.1~~GHRR01023635.1.p1  ORF type:complete len:178 (-),score=21.11 GHRR01023635.1:283-816(-)